MNHPKRYTHTFYFIKNFPFCESHWTSSLYYVYFFFILNVLFLCYYYSARVQCNNLPFEMRVKKINRKKVDENGVYTPEEEKYRSKNVTHIRWQTKKMYFCNRCNLLNIRTLFIKIACGQMCGEWVNGRRQKIEQLEIQSQMNYRLFSVFFFDTCIIYIYANSSKSGWLPVFTAAATHQKRNWFLFSNGIT